MSQAIDILNTSEHCEVISGKDLFFDYDQLLDKYYCKPTTGTIISNHLFSFVQEEDPIKGRVITTTVPISDNIQTETIQELIYTNPCFQTKQERENGLVVETPIALESIGISEQKQVHLYTKWRRIVPP